MLKLSFKNKAYQEVELSSHRITIGRDQNNHVVLTADGVSGYHAEIQCENEKVFLVDLGSTNGTFVNGRKISGRQEIKAWDIIQFDDIEAELVDTDRRRPTMVRPAIGQSQVRPPSGAGATQVRSPAGAENQTRLATSLSPRLEVLEGKEKGKKYPLSGSRVTLGRNQGNMIRLNDDTVSGNHAVLTLDSGIWNVEDLGSTNGTFVNRKKVTQKNLTHNDNIQFGEMEFKFLDPFVKSAAETRAAPSAAPPNTTRVTPSVSASDNTRVSPTLHKGFPAWIYGLIGFAVVILVLGVLYAVGTLKPNKPQIEAKLQTSRIWARELSGREIAATPVLCDINGDRFLDVIVADSSGFVLALDGAEGKLIFEAQIMDRILASPVAGDLSGNGIDDVVVASISGIVIALNGKGQSLWQSDPALGLGEIMNRPVLEDLNGDGIPDVIVPTSNKGLVALDGARGWEIWNTGEMTKGKVITSPLRVDVNGDGVVDFVALTDTGHVFAISSKGGKVWQIWENRVSAIYYASPLYVNLGQQSLIVVATDGGGIVALNAENGRTVWTSKIQKRFFASPLATDTNRNKMPEIVAVAENGDIHVLESLTGDEIWRTSLDVGVKATPALFDVNNDGVKDLIILDEAGNIRVVDTSRGREIMVVGVSGAGGFLGSPLMGDVNNDEMVEIVSAGKNGVISAHSLNRLVKRGEAVWPCFLGNDQHGM